ncbi:MAG: hypothetical protein ACI9MC_002731 [Kiritimatiellia bacterium]|jgi:hypothetical protein
MSGTISGSDATVTSAICGTCTEVYEIDGTFTDSYTPEGTFNTSFIGGSNCVDRTEQT